MKHNRTSILVLLLLAGVAVTSCHRGAKGKKDRHNYRLAGTTQCYEPRIIKHENKTYSNEYTPLPEKSQVYWDYNPDDSTQVQYFINVKGKYQLVTPFSSPLVDKDHTFRYMSSGNLYISDPLPAVQVPAAQ